MNKIANEGTNAFVGQILSTNYPIVECILTNLSVKELITVRIVCKLWNAIAKKILQNRKIIFWFMKAVKRQCPRFNNYKLDLTDAFVARKLKDIEEAYITCLQEAKGLPKFAIVFASRYLNAHPAYFFTATNPDHFQEPVYKENSPSTSSQQELPFQKENKNKRKTSEPHTNSYKMFVSTKLTLADYLLHKLPNDCKLFGCSSNGVIGTISSPCQSFESEFYHSLSVLFLPDFPEITYHTFFLPSISEKSIGDDLLKAEAFYDKILDLPPERPLRCLILLFQPWSDFDASAHFIEYVLKKYNNNVALGGAFTDKFIYPVKDNQKQHCNCYGLAFAGTEVNAASLVVPKGVDSEKEVTNLLENLRKNLKFKINKYTIGFCFACVGRGEHHYGKPNVEANAFNRVFPNIPLFGLFGNGEIGINYPPIQKNHEPSPLGMEYYHTYTSIFVIVSLKNG